MRKFSLSILLALLTFAGVFAQQSVVVYDGGNAVFTKHLWEFDSIVFAQDTLPDYHPLPKTEAVDVGFKAKWAPRNVGAASPFDKGVLFGWGETTGLTCSDKLKHYPFEGVSQGISGTGFDIATARWGLCWSMPTLDDFRELMDGCAWELVDTLGVKAFKASKGDEEVFFPVTGYREGRDSIEGDNLLSLFWSCDICANRDKAYALQLKYNEEKDSVEVSVVNKLRSLGLAVRPVYHSASIVLLGSPFVTYNSAILDIEARGDVEEVISYGIECATTAESLETGVDVRKCYADIEQGFKATIRMENLDERHTYFFRLFIETTDGMVYSDIQTFATLHNNHANDYVDLGLPSGLKWATMNLGATKPSEYGFYFAWGETEPKGVFTRDNYVMVNENGEKVDSCVTENGIKVRDPLTGAYRLVNYMESISETQYDAAQAVWGEMWRMPTKQDFQELLDNCTWEWEIREDDYVAGAKVTSKRNGRSIFLPAAGQKNWDEVSFEGEYGLYWTANIYDNEYSSDYGDTAYPFSVSEGHYIAPLGTSRHLGLSIRPVRR